MKISFAKSCLDRKLWKQKLPCYIISRVWCLSEGWIHFHKLSVVNKFLWETKLKHPTVPTSYLCTMISLQKDLVHLENYPNAFLTFWVTFPNLFDYAVGLLKISENLSDHNFWGGNSQTWPNRPCGTFIF